MKTLHVFIFLPFLWSSACGYAQQGSTRKSECIPKPDTLDGQKVYRLASKLAQYPGGDAAMLDFIAKNFKHVKGKNNGKKTLTITIVIDAFGKVRNPCVVRKKSDVTDENTEAEIIRVFISMPRWEPAELNGKKTYTRIIMPVQLWLD
ncbi:MAG: hypothetical protein ACHQRM_09510 [Bacteroidia bacterium]